MGLFDKLFKRKGVDEKTGWSKKKTPAEKYPEYYRLHQWLEWRLGPLSADEDDRMLKKRLLRLLDTEEQKDPKRGVEGLREYIESNSYRKMLGS